jgi:AcrR family transcriptional regulator
MLDAAGRLFGSRRFHEVRMEDIAAEARVSKGTLYRYFSDKEELYLALLTRATRQLVERLRQSVEKAEGPRVRLVALVSTVLDYFDAQPHLLDLIQRVEVLRSARSAFPWQQARDEMFRLVLEALQQGGYAAEDPHLAALILLGGLRAVIRFGQRPRPSDLAERVVATVLGEERTERG